jgi:hypothetical protein
MAGAAAEPVSDDSEEARAFLRDRVALFWKVTFFIILFRGAAALPTQRSRFTPQGTATYR